MSNKKNEATFEIKGLMNLDVSQLTSQINIAKTSLNKLSLPKNVENSFSELFLNITKQIEDFEQKSKRTFRNMGDVKEAEKSYAKLQQYIEEYNLALSKIDPNKLSFKNKIEIPGLKESLNIIKQFDDKVENTRATFNELKSTLKDKVQLYVKTDDLIQAASNGENLGHQLRQLKEYKKTLIEVDSSEIDATSKKILELKEQLEYAEKAKKKFGADAQSAKQETTKNRNKELYENEIKVINKLQQELDETTKKQEILKQSLEEYANVTQAIERITALYKELQKASKGNFSELFGDENLDLTTIQKLKQYVESIQTNQIQEINNQFERLQQQADETGDTVKAMGVQLEEGVKKPAVECQTLNDQVTALRNNFLDFFSLTNGWYLLKRAINSAYETVKELDASMTEIAVVSDYTLDEIWSMRKEYSDAATEMGAKTIDLVDATKLYVQQGLDLNEAMQVGIETTKMARIANLDGAEATNLMTAALRGFNMEMTEANKVNDVYSELAAKSAADTQEIAVAMSKTASIAYNAGSSFENTAAFLTQIIETTREAPETAGTAMKTIVARFQELKKPLSEIGEVDGEIVDANAIETALRQAGVALRDVNGEFRNFDDVILELASKWNSLDIMTQRYIATTAAGSRQQSRFLALMENNERLLELTGYAANSAGAAQQQFNKTLDSLEAKINKLNNSLDIFWTNLANNTIIKTSVDLLTQLLNIVNSLISTFSNSSNPVLQFFGSFLQIGIIYAGFQGATKIIHSFSRSAVNTMSQAGTEAGQSFSNNLEKSMSQRIKGTYKNAISSILGVGNGTSNKAIKQQKKEFEILKRQYLDSGNKILEELNTEFSKNSGKINLIDIEKIFDNKKINSLGTQGAQKLGEVLQQSFAKADIFKGLTDEQKSIAQSELNNFLNSWGQGDYSKSIQTFKNNLSQKLNINAKDMKLDLNFSEVLNSIDQANVKLPLLSDATAKYSIVAGAAAFATSGLAKILENAGYEEAASSVRTFSTILTSVSTGLLITTTLLQAFNIQIQLTASIVAPLIGLVGLLTIGFIALSSQSESIDSRIEKNNESIANLNEQVSELQTQLNELESASTKLDDLYNSFYKLNEGSIEWKETLLEINQQILDLVDKYPELNDKITFDENGLMHLEDNAIKEVTKQQQEEIFNKQQTSIALQAENQRYEMEKVLQPVKDLFTNLSTTEYTQDLTLNQRYLDNLNNIIRDFSKVGDNFTISDTQQILKKYGIGLNQNDLQQFYSDIKNIPDWMSEDAGDFSRVGNEAEQAALNLQKFNEQLINNSLEDNAWLQQIKNKELVEGTKGAISRLNPNIDQSVSERSKQLADWSDNSLAQTYVDKIGGDLTEIKQQLSDGAITKEQLAQEIAMAETNEEINKQAEIISKNLMEISSDNIKMGDALSRLASENQEQIDQSTLDFLRKTFPKEMTGQEILDSIGIEKWEDIGFTSFTEFQAAIDNAENALNGFSNSLNASEIEIEQIKEYQSKDNYKQVVGDLTLGSKQGFDSKLLELTRKNGEANIDSFINSINELDIPEDELNGFISSLNGLDFSSEKSIRNFSTVLKQIGVDLPTSKVDEFEEQLIKLNGSFDSLSLEELNNQVLNTSQLIKRIKDEQSATISEEEYNNLSSINPDLAEQFSLSISGDYVYLGNSINELITALQNNTSAILQKNIEQAQANVAIGETALNMGNANPSLYDLNNISDWSSQQIESFLSTFMSRMQSQGIDTRSSLGYANDYSIGNLNEAQQQELLQKITILISEISTNRDYAEQAQVNASSLNYQNKGAGYTAAMGAVKSINDNLTEADANAMNKALITMANEAGVAQDAVLKLNEAISNNDKEAAQAARNEIALATDIKKAGERITEYAQDILDAKENLDKLEKGSIQYNQVLSDMTKMINGMLGFSLSDNFLQDADNLQYLIDGLNGSQSAWNNFIENAMLAQASTEAFAQQFGLSSNQIIDICNILDTVTFDINGEADFTQIFQQLIAVTGSAKKAAEILNALGMSFIEFDVEYDTTDLGQVMGPVEPSSINSLMGGDWSQRLATDLGKITYVKAVRATNVHIPALGASNYGGTGGSSGGGGSGGGGGGGSSGGGGGGGSSETPEDPWEESYDWLYNLVKKTEEETRKLTKLQWEYSKAIKESAGNAKEVFENMKEQEASLKRQQDYYAQQMEGRLTEQQRIENEYSDVRKYANYNETLGYVEIDWDAIHALSGKTGNNETGERIDEYISKLEELSSQIDEIEDVQMDIIDQLEELEKMGMDEYRDLEQRVFDALVQKRQDEIDKLTELNDSINDANTKMLDKIQTGLDDYRNAREMAESKQDITDMETRLALMQSDTSGANALEILSLQEQLKDARQDYTDSLIDKSINEMTKQNEEAYEQRNMQIELMQAQLDWDQESGLIAQQTNELMTKYLAEGPEDLMNLLKESDIWKGMAAGSKEEWIDTFSQGYNAGMAGWVNSHLVKDKGQSITFTDKNGKQQTGTIVGEGQVQVGNKIYSGIYQTPNGNYSQQLEDGKITNIPSKPDNNAGSGGGSSGGPIKVGGLINAGSAPIYDYAGDTSGEHQYYSDDPIYKVLSEKNGYLLTRYHKLSSGYTGWFKKSDVKAYAKGGLADFTGPAWLDGKKSEPEYVLNAEQTKGWLNLVDMLGNFNSKTGTALGNTYYDVHIEVDQINNDYDVEQMMNKMKKIIEQDASYRNVNAVDLGRR